MLPCRCTARNEPLTPASYLDHQRYDKQECRRGREGVAEGEPVCPTQRIARSDMVDSRRPSSQMTLDTEVGYCRIMTQAMGRETLPGKGVTVDEAKTIHFQTGRGGL